MVNRMADGVVRCIQKYVFWNRIVLYQRNGTREAPCMQYDVKTVDELRQLEVGGGRGAAAAGHERGLKAPKNLAFAELRMSHAATNDAYHTSHHHHP